MRTFLKNSVVRKPILAFNEREATHEGYQKGKEFMVKEINSFLRALGIIFYDIEKYLDSTWKSTLFQNGIQNDVQRNLLFDIDNAEDVIRV